MNTEMMGFAALYPSYIRFAVIYPGYAGYRLLNADAWELLYEPRCDSALDDKVAAIRPVDWEEESIPLREFIEIYRQHRELFQT